MRDIFPTFSSYDKAGNRTLEQVNTTGSAVAAAVHNSVNQVVSRNGGGAMVFEGTVSKPSKVIVGGTNGAGGVRAVLDAANTFRATVPVSIGAQSVEIQATDANGNVTTKHAQVTVTAGTAGQVFTYDDDGNMLSDGTRTFSWDAENRLVKVITGTDMREWVYNGAGLRVARKLNGAVSKQWVWDGTTLREQRDAANNVTRRYYGQGVVQGATLPAAATDKLCYTRDHLGSIRELVDGTGALRARYEYDPYGDRTKLSGTADADLGYTGHYQDVSGSLLAAPFRCYDPKLGRWLSRDPIGEEGGINLYGYVLNNPVSLWDALGLDPNLNLFTPGTYIYNNAQNIKPNGTAYIVTGHGTSANVFGPDSKTISPDQLAEKIKSDPKYKPGTPVTLLTCNSGNGSNPYGQQLAAALKAPVNACPTYVWFYQSGDVKIYPAKGGNMSNGPDTTQPRTTTPFQPPKP
jgi:RHS repeat-associated protein